MGRRREVTVLPKALQAWRKERGYSQKELGVRSGVSPTMIAMIETGERQPTRLNAEDIADALNLDLEAIAFVYPHEVVAAEAS